MIIMRNGKASLNVSHMTEDNLKFVSTASQFSDETRHAAQRRLRVEFGYIPMGN